MESINSIVTRHTKNLSSYTSSLWHGLGLFGESYLLFSVGTLRPFWETLYPACFDIYDNTVCRFPALSYQSITYSVVLGVMVGMIAIGALSNTIGRRRGSILTASFMAVGSMCLFLSSIFLSHSPSILFPVMSVCLFLFGIGVGGEYPLSASSASERAMASMKKVQREEAENIQRMKNLLNPGMAESTATPRQGNNKNAKQTKHKEDGKEESLMTSSWQTLEVKTSHGDDRTPQAEQYDGHVLALSPTNITQETNNSLATANANLRTRGREVLLVFSMQGLGILVRSRYSVTIHPHFFLSLMPQNNTHPISSLFVVTCPFPRLIH